MKAKGDSVDLNDVLDIFLQPGEFYWGDRLTRIRTLLGSCVSIAIWHPVLKVGGMCHIMLPRRGGANPDGRPDGRYADEAMALFLKEIKAVDPKPANYTVKVFGGGNMMPAFDKAGNVAERNLLAARELLQTNGFKIEAESAGGNRYRKLIFEMWSGDVWVKEQEISQVPVHFRDKIND